jgi:hypothetical protein
MMPTILKKIIYKYTRHRIYNHFLTFHSNYMCNISHMTPSSCYHLCVKARSQVPNQALNKSKPLEYQQYHQLEQEPDIEQIKIIFIL